MNPACLCGNLIIRFINGGRNPFRFFLYFWLPKPLNDFSPYNEQELLEQLRAGSSEAFTQLYRQYSEQLYYNILALVKDDMVAEELLQDIFVRIWQRKENLQVEKS